MPARCSICTHPRLAFIDRQVATGRPLLGISREVSCGYDSLRRHVLAGHAKEALIHAGTIWQPPNSGWATRRARQQAAYEAPDEEEDPETWRAELDLAAYARLEAHIAADRDTGEGAFARLVASLPPDERAWLQTAVDLVAEPADLWVAVKYDLPLADVQKHFAEHHQ